MQISENYFFLSFTVCVIFYLYPPYFWIKWHLMKIISIFTMPHAYYFNVPKLRSRITYGCGFLLPSFIFTVWFSLVFKAFIYLDWYLRYTISWIESFHWLCALKLWLFLIVENMNNCFWRMRVGRWPEVCDRASWTKNVFCLHV